MACSCNERYQKSTIVAINTSAQAFVAAGTTLSAGSVVEKTGVSLALSGNGIGVNNTGLYSARASVTFVPSATGNVTLAMYVNGVMLPCSLRTVTVTSGETYTVDTVAPSFEASKCCMIAPVITVMISGLAGSVSWMCQSGMRLA